MKNLTKKASFIVALLFLVTVVLAGCGGGTTTNTPSSTAVTTQAAATQSTAQADPYQEEIKKGEVTLKYYLLGDANPDQQKVWDEINKLMMKDINTKIDVQNISWSDWGTKYPLIFNSGEDFDFTFTADWCFYTDTATKGGYLELKDDMLKAYCPNTAPLLLGDFNKAYKSTFISGKAYILSLCNNNADGLYSGLIRGDLREKYGLPEVKSFEDLITYVQTVCVKEKMPLVDANNRWIGAWTNSKNYDWVGGFVTCIGFDKNKNDGKIFNLVESPEFLEYAKIQKKLQDSGAISKSALSNKIEAKVQFVNGTTPVVIQGLGGLIGLYNECMSKHPEFKPEFIDYQGNNKVGHPASTAGYVINANSKHPERALMAADLLHSKKEYYDLLECGIPGVHYEPVGDNKYKQLEEGAKNYPVQSVCPWSLVDERFDRLNVTTPDTYINLSKNYASRIEWLKTDGFVFDDSKVKSEKAAISSVQGTYQQVISCGLGGDPEKAVKTYAEKLKAAGIDKVIQEAQAQMDKYISSNNK